MWLQLAGDNGGVDGLWRMFLAVRPSAAATAELARLDRSEVSSVRWEDPANWHITIRFFPRAPVGGVIAAVDALGALAAPTVVLGPSVAILGKGVVIVPADGVGDLATTVERASREFEAEPSNSRRPFAGHLTLGRLRKGNRTCELVGRRFDASFVADGMDLVVSTPQSNGAHRHEVAHRWGFSLSAA